MIIDTSSAGAAPRHHELLTKVSAAPIRYIILTHGHGDHTGGVHLWKQDGTQIVTQRNFPDVLRLSGSAGRMYFARTNAAQFNFDEARLRSAVAIAARTRSSRPITFDDRYDFELGGVKFEIFHTPGRNARRSDRVAAQVQGRVRRRQFLRFVSQHLHAARHAAALGAGLRRRRSTRCSR